MAAKRKYHYPPVDEIARLRDKGHSWRELSESYGIPERSFYDHYQRQRVGQDGDEAPDLAVLPDGSRSAFGAKGWTTDEIIRHFGDDPAECVVTAKSATLWGDPEDPQERLRVNWTRTQDVIQAADPADWTPPPKPKKRKHTGPRKVVICGDQHVPFHDRTLHKLFLEWLADEQPDEGIINGDLFDFATISRHRERSSHARGVNENIQTGFNVLSDYRSASVNTRWKMKKGNHCARLEHLILDNAAGLHNITAADDDVPALSLRRLLHLDRLGIEFIEEDWDVAKVRLSRKLSTRHGPSTGKQATKALLDKFSVSVIQNHTHRLSMLFRTEHTDEEDEPTTTRMAAEAGCMCEIHNGLGYADSPDWNQGFLVVNIWEDGDFQVSPVPYVPGRLLAPSGKRYVA